MKQERGHQLDEVEWDFGKIVRRLLAKRLTLLMFLLGGAIVGLGIALLLPPWFKAQVVFLPPKNADLPASFSASSLLRSEDSSDTYLGMLMSRTVAEDVVDHAGLMQEYKATTRTQAKNTLSANSNFLVNKNSLLVVDVKASTPQLAAKIADAYLDALYRLNGEMVASASFHRREFFEQQLDQQKTALAQAELEMKKTEEQTGIVLPAGEAQAGLTATAQLQSAIGAAETRLAGLLMAETEQNPQVAQARAELAALRGQLLRQQANTKAQTPGGGLASTAKLPGLTLEYMRKARELKLRESIYDSLTQQYEKARIGSIDPGPQLQVVDRAIIPEQKSGPPRRLLIIGGAFAGLILGLVQVLVWAKFRRILRELLSPPTIEVEG
ncbi:hypothetical protein BH10ACI4_BH10ACI4_15900 [soil metagenome]